MLRIFVEQGPGAAGRQSITIGVCADAGIEERIATASLQALLPALVSPDCVGVCPCSRNCCRRSGLPSRPCRPMAAPPASTPPG